ncbi:DNA-3-methyladenine glycosylase I [Cryomorpha ignava]|uniref:DNA-3-methyladenine glycosylase I n=1 Tax=Cryomorpha ignava TaxID=101383 RepID=A0A7K3WQ97_9FLAO|nr:DNA-3-methyladenine glycosylase I [Cryomorpha ignava]NEN23839.1 DNA-3-methyladenine glycosylase I [Cryomorpha ignava]
MDIPKSYCQAIRNGELSQVHIDYHDRAYGFPIEDDNELFGRLILEINQAGLSWDTILKKRDNFRKAYADFDIDKIAAFDESDRERLLADAGIIRNKLKVNAAIHNAQKIVELQKEHGSFKAWLDKNHPLKREEWVKLFKKTFKFTGGEITNEFLMSTGFLSGTHDSNCPVFMEIEGLKPKWMD